MASLNKVIIIGHCGKDPETRYAPSGDAITNLTVATSETWKDKNSGDKKESTEWHRVVMFSKLAEIAAKYLKKGSLVYLEGRLQTRKWQDSNGQDRYTTEIRCDEMKMLGGKPEGASEPRQPAQQPRQPAAKPVSEGGSGFDSFPDDIPFNRHAAGAAWRVI